MIQVRKSEERGHAQQGWLDSRHTFSFSDYQDPRFMGFRVLRVINEDRVQPGEGFGEHGHRDMEIISYVLDGRLEHKDSLGTGSVIQPGDVQRMSAGRGVLHSEFNPSKNDLSHFLQIWITPSERGIEPSYEEKKFTAEEKHNRLRLIVSPEGDAGSVRIHQDALLYAALLEEGQEVRHELRPGRHAWVQVARGAIDLNGTSLRTGDGAAVSDERSLTLLGRKSAEVLLFDLP